MNNSRILRTIQIQHAMNEAHFDNEEFKKLLKQYPYINDLQRYLIENNITQQSLYNIDILCLFTTNYLPSKNNSSKSFINIILNAFFFIIQVIKNYQIGIG